MRVVSLFSGSGGNCLFVEKGHTRLLVDAGVSFRRIRDALLNLDVSLDSLSGVFFTHEHADHTAALRMLTNKTDLPFFLNVASADDLYYNLLSKDARAADAFASRVRTVSSGNSYEIGEMVFSPFDLPHDSVACQGVVFGTESDEKILGVATDLGEMTPESRRALTGCRNIVLESNHDVKMLEEGPYPPYLKERILSSFGHLSNPDAAAFLQALVQGGAERVLLFHLSRENNTPSLALSCAKEALNAIGAAKADVFLAAAAPDCSVVLSET